MPDFLAPPADAISASHAAVRYALKRYIADPDFRYHLVSTELLRKLVIAEAGERGLEVDVVSDELAHAYNEYAARLQRERGESASAYLVAQLPRLRDRLERIEACVRGLRDRGQLDPRIADSLIALAEGCTKGSL